MAELVKDGLEVDLDTARDDDGNVAVIEALLEAVECFGLAKVLGTLRAAAENAIDADLGAPKDVADALRRFAAAADAAEREVRS